MRILIADDEPLARKRIKSLLADVPDAEVVAECANGRETVEAIRLHAPDVVFLDIQMPELDGFGVVQHAGQVPIPAIIFVTAFDEFAVRAFEVHALDYLLKPFDRDRFNRALQRARDHVARGQVAVTHAQIQALLADLKPVPPKEERILIKSAGRAVLIPVSDIDWIESAGNYVTIRTAGQSHLLRDTMKSMEQRLDPRTFRRIHRNIIVNINRIKELHTMGKGEYVLKLRDGAKLTVSRRFRSNLDGAL
jgi:two-component system LytT family response regulator